MRISVFCSLRATLFGQFQDGKDVCIVPLTLASLEYEGDFVPSLILDVCNHGTACRASRFLGHCRLLCMQACCHRMFLFFYIYIHGYEYRASRSLWHCVIFLVRRLVVVQDLPYWPRWSGRSWKISSALGSQKSLVEAWHFFGSALGMPQRVKRFASLPVGSESCTQPGRIGANATVQCMEVRLLVTKIGVRWYKVFGGAYTTSILCFLR